MQLIRSPNQPLVIISVLCAILSISPLLSSSTHPLIHCSLYPAWVVNNRLTPILANNNTCLELRKDYRISLHPEFGYVRSSLVVSEFPTTTLFWNHNLFIYRPKWLETI